MYKSKYKCVTTVPVVLFNNTPYYINYHLYTLTRNSTVRDFVRSLSIKNKIPMDFLFLYAGNDLLNGDSEMGKLYDKYQDNECLNLYLYL